ncbi:MAG: sensor histidine kinase [Gammaproteobacteria bacterium]|nr:sensor histidine kinase [Gammaproteobacteria bacterium]
MLDKDPIQNSDRNSPIFITEFLSHVKFDKEIALSEIISEDLNFQKVDKKVLNYGYNKNFYWFKVKLVNTSNEDGEWLLSTGLRSPALLDIYEMAEGQYHKIFQHRSNYHYSQRPIDHRYLFIKLHLDAHQEKTIYIHLKNTLGLRMVPKIFSPTDFYNHWRVDYLYIGIFLACLATLIVVNLAQYIATLKPIYFVYSNLVLWSGLSVTQHSGLNLKFLWPNHPEVDQLMTSIITVPSAILMIQVMRTAMQLGKHSLIVDRIALFFMSLWGLSIPLMLIFDSNLIFSWLTLSVPPTGLILLTAISVVSIVKRIQSAGFYFVGWVSFYIAISTFNLMHSGIEILTNVESSVYIYGAGVMIEGLLLFLALAHQTRIFHRNNAKNRLKTIELLEDKVVDLKLIGQLNSEKQQAQNENRQKSLQFASTSHDIHQPLSAIRTFLSDWKNTKNNEVFPNKVIEEIELIEEMLRDTILNSKDEISRPLELVSLNRLFNQLFTQNYEQARQNKIQLKFVPTSISFSGSKIIILRILDNLIKNALRVTSNGKVMYGVRRVNNAIEIQVLDNGPGIHASDIDRLTKPFQQGINEDDNGSHGLGLSIVSALCEQQNYHFSVTSKIGIGSKFSIAITQ